MTKILKIIKLEADKIKLKASVQRFRALKKSIKSANEKAEEYAKYPLWNPNPIFRISKNGILLHYNTL